jgi:hypothetical protein
MKKWVWGLIGLVFLILILLTIFFIYPLKKTDIQKTDKDNISCESINNLFDKDDCDLRLAIKDNDISKCNNIGNSDNNLGFIRGIEERYACIAFINNDISVCESIPSELKNQFTQNNCYIHLASLKKDKTICENKIQDQEVKDSCYSKVAIFNNESNLCNYILDTTGKDMCYYDIAISQIDLLICDKMSLDNKDSLIYKNRYSCYSSIAFLKKDEKICDKIDGLNQKNYCYYGLAITKTDLLICDKVSTEDKSFNQDRCYASIAYLKKDKNICSHISNKTLNEQCNALVEFGIKNPDYHDPQTSPTTEVTIPLNLTFIKTEGKVNISSKGIELIKENGPAYYDTSFYLKKDIHAINGSYFISFNYQFKSKGSGDQLGIWINDQQRFIVTGELTPDYLDSSNFGITDPKGNGETYFMTVALHNYSNGEARVLVKDFNVGYSVYD